MTIKSGFFNSVNGDRKYSANNFAEYFASFIGNGVFPAPSTNLQVVEGTNMTTIVKPGKGWINGYFVVNDSDYVLQHDIADGVLKRIDRVVMRLNYLTRQIEIDVKKGTSASNPVAPTLQRDTDYVELALADILISNGVTAITQANITDTRLNSSLCGIVHGTVNQVDTTTIFNQYQAWFNDYSAKAKQEFEVWLVTLENILDGDVATNLAARILNLEEHKLDTSVFSAFENSTTTTLTNLEQNKTNKVDFKNHTNTVASPTVLGHVKAETDASGVLILPKGQTLITEVFLNSSVTSVSFSNLNLEDYKEITIIGICRPLNANLNIYFNNVTTGLTSIQTQFGSSAVSSTTNLTSMNFNMAIYGSDTYIKLDILNEINRYKFIDFNAMIQNGTALGNVSGVVGYGRSTLTNAINTVTLNTSFGDNSKFLVTGVKR